MDIVSYAIGVLMGIGIGIGISKTKKEKDNGST
jgi:hypothetical protein